MPFLFRPARTAPRQARSRRLRSWLRRKGRRWQTSKPAARSVHRLLNAAAEGYFLWAANETASAAVVFSRCQAFAVQFSGGQDSAITLKLCDVYSTKALSSKPPTSQVTFVTLRKRDLLPRTMRTPTPTRANFRRSTWRRWALEPCLIPQFASKEKWPGSSAVSTSDPHASGPKKKKAFRGTWPTLFHGRIPPTPEGLRKKK